MSVGRKYVEHGTPLGEKSKDPENALRPNCSVTSYTGRIGSQETNLTCSTRLDTEQHFWPFTLLDGDRPREGVAKSLGPNREDTVSMYYKDLLVSSVDSRCVGLDGKCL